LSAKKVNSIDVFPWCNHIEIHNNKAYCTSNRRTRRPRRPRESPLLRYCWLLAFSPHECASSLDITRGQERHERKWTRDVGTLGKKTWPCVDDDDEPVYLCSWNWAGKTFFKLHVHNCLSDLLCLSFSFFWEEWEVRTPLPMIHTSITVIVSTRSRGRVTFLHFPGNLDFELPLKGSIWECNQQELKSREFLDCRSTERNFLLETQGVEEEKEEIPVRDLLRSKSLNHVSREQSSWRLEGA